LVPLYNSTFVVIRNYLFEFFDLLIARRRSGGLSTLAATAITLSVYLQYLKVSTDSEYNS